MTLTQKKIFINGLIETVKIDILKNVDKFPENWDGFELRRIIADYFNKTAWMTMSKKRKKEYNNEVIVNNLI